MYRDVLLFERAGSLCQTPLPGKPINTICRIFRRQLMAIQALVVLHACHGHILTWSHLAFKPILGKICDSCHYPTLLMTCMNLRVSHCRKRKDAGEFTVCHDPQTTNPIRNNFSNCCRDFWFILNNTYKYNYTKPMREVPTCLTELFDHITRFTP